MFSIQMIGSEIEVIASLLSCHLEIDQGVAQTGGVMVTTLLIEIKSLGYIGFIIK